MPTSLLNGRPAAGGLALINTIGVTGGIFGPVVVGAAKDAGSLEAGLGALAVVLLGGTALAARCPSWHASPPSSCARRSPKPRPSGPLCPYDPSVEITYECEDECNRRALASAHSLGWGHRA
jgi:hypothetical protein